MGHIKYTQNIWYRNKVLYCNPLLFRCRFNLVISVQAFFTEIKSLPKFLLRVDGFCIPLAVPKFSPYRNGEFSLYRKVYATEIKVDYSNKMMHFCAITSNNECSLFDWFKSLQCPTIVLTVVKKCMFFKNFRGAAPNPAGGGGGVTASPLTQAGFHLGRLTVFYRATALCN